MGEAARCDPPVYADGHECAAEETKKKKEQAEAGQPAKRALPPSLQSAKHPAAAPATARNTAAGAVDLCGSQEGQPAQSALGDVSNKRAARRAHGSASPDTSRSPDAKRACAPGGAKGVAPTGALAKARASSAGAKGGSAIAAAQIPIQNQFSKYEAKQVAWQKRSSSAGAHSSAGPLGGK